MVSIVNFIIRRLNQVDLTSPIFFFDLGLAIFLVLGFLLYIRKFPVFRVILGVLFLLGCSVFFFSIGLVYTALVFGVVSNLVLISLPLIFAPEIRHYLEKLGRFPFLKILKITQRRTREGFIQQVVNAVYGLAERKTGALIALQRTTGLAETVETGVELDAEFSPELLGTVFYSGTPLHDGAVVIVGERIRAAGCLLPISADIKLGPPFGTRHKSGLAITRDTDAVVVIVSEQRGQVSLAENGKLEIGLNRDQLTDRLLKLLL